MPESTKGYILHRHSFQVIVGHLLLVIIFTLWHEHKFNEQAERKMAHILGISFFTLVTLYLFYPRTKNNCIYQKR